jgi:sucrose-6-phosphate hydrolase SacC (GH32 family)
MNNLYYFQKKKNASTFLLKSVLCTIFSWLNLMVIELMLVWKSAEWPSNWNNWRSCTTLIKKLMNFTTLLILNFRVWTLKPYETKHLNPAALRTLRFTKNPRIIIEHNVLAEKIESRHTMPSRLGSGNPALTNYEDESYINKTSTNLQVDTQITTKLGRKCANFNSR